MLGALTHAEVEWLHGAAISAFHEAVSRQGCSVLKVEIAGIPIDIETAGDELMLAIRPALAGIAVPQTPTKASRILVYDLETSGLPAPQFDRPIQHLIRWRGDCWTEPAARFRVVFHMFDHTLHVFDSATDVCVVIISSVKKLPSWTLAAPLRTPLSMVLESSGAYLVHGAAMGDANGALLVTGYGGSGKSTSTLSCHKAGMPIMGDDYVVIRPPMTGKDRPTVHNIFSSLKVMPQELGEEAAGHPLNDKRIIFPFSHSIDGLLREAPLVAMVSARIANSTLTKTYMAAPEEVARIAYASTSLQIPMLDEEIYSASILECVRQTGAYRMEFGSDRSLAPKVIGGLLAKHAGPPALSLKPAWSIQGSLKPVSVIIPIHNGSRFIAEAVASIAEQKYPDLEIIIVDDGSTDDLSAALESIPVPFKLIRQKQQGPASARNAGIRESQKAWIAFLDADDLWTPMALKTMAGDLMLHENAGVVHGTAVTFRNDPDTGKYVNAYHPRGNYPFYIGGGLYRRSSFDVVGYFDDTLLHGEDTDWYWRALEVGLPIINIAENVLKIRMHDANMTSNVEAADQGRRQVLKRRILRSRHARSAIL